MLCLGIAELQDFYYAQKSSQFFFLQKFQIFFFTAIAETITLILEFVLAVFLSCGPFLSAEARSNYLLFYFSGL